MNVSQSTVRCDTALGANARRGLNPWRRAVLGALRDLREGEITLHDGGERFTFGAASESFPVAASITVNSPAFYRAVALGGSLGVGESHVEGHWDCDDLPALIRIAARNQRALAGLEGGLARLGEWASRLFHLLHRNTRAGSRRNIAAHYDLSNDFFALWLDETMTYSSGIFERADSTLREASEAKLERLCRKLDLRPTDHLLEIGTGWGSMAIHAARHHGCRVTTTTISREQHDLAAQRIREAGLEDRVTLLLRDYRDLEGQFDKVVSIEMIEAVGHEYLDGFFAKVSSLLRPDGMAAIQAITIRDHEFARYRRGADFIQRHVFPGSCLMAVSQMMGSVARASDLTLSHLEEIGPHYERTLLEWRRRFHARRREIRALGFDERFMRLWDYYLCYCAGGFAERWIGTAQLVLSKPHCRRVPILPPLPAP